MTCLWRVALLLVLGFLSVHSSEHHAHDHNHQDSHSHADVLSAFDHHFHEYHHHHPVEQPNCGEICPKSLPKFQQFEVGHVYTVELDGQTLLNVKEGQTIGLKTKIDVHVLSPCEFTLGLRESQVSGVPNPQELAQQLDSSPVLRFGAHDGKVLGVCPSPEEQSWTLNVKKAALSAMQVTSKDLTTTAVIEEVDFSGHCTTTYRPLSDTSDTSNILVEKTKNLNKCHLRRKNIAGFQSKSLGLMTEFVRENFPLVKSTQRCLQEIKSGHLFSVSCTEEQKFSLNDDSFIVSTLNLRFGGKAAKPLGGVTPAPKTAQTLLMTRDDEGQKTTNEADLKALLQKICTQISSTQVDPEVTESFHCLVRGLRNLPEAGVKALDELTKGTKYCPSKKLRDMFLGASAFAASDASIQTLVNAYNNKELSDTQITLMLGWVALRTRPSETTIDSLVPLIQKENSFRSLTLGVSLMVRNFCKRNENCLTVAAVKNTINALLEKLQKSSSDLERIATIKSLDNIRAKTDDTVKAALVQWAQKSDADTGVRIAAIQALQRLADDDIRQKLIDIFSKHSEPTEVRAAAYRAVVLSGATAAQLEAIKSGQLGLSSYVQTHVANLRKNRPSVLPPNTPDFGEPAPLAIGVTRNIQMGYKGATIEADIVYPKGSQMVPLPGLFTFGLWFPVGGKEYQLVEIQIRQSGLTQHLQKLISKGIGGPEMLAQLSEELIELLTFLKDPDHQHNIQLQVSVRISGSNILFIDTFEDLHKMAVLLKNRMKELYNAEEVDMIRALSLLDQQVEVPAILGFPTVFHLNETIVVAMTAEHSWTDAGTNKVRKIKSSRTYLDELSAGVAVKVREYRPGFEWHMRVEINPTTDAQFERIDGRILKAKINLPTERRTMAKLVQSTRLLDGYGVPKQSRGRRSADDNVKCREMIGLNVCRSRQLVDNSPIPNVEYYVSRIDPTVDSVELTLEKPAASATRDLLVWSAKANAGQREYLAQVEVRNPRDGPKKGSLKLQSPKRTITADITASKSSDGNTSKLEFDLKLPNVIDLNTKYNFEQKGEEQNTNALTEYQLAGSDRKETIKYNRKSSLSLKRDKKSKVINVLYNQEIQFSQFPEYDSRFSYYSNIKPYQTTKGDLKFEWGRGLKDRLRVASSSNMDIIELRPFQATTEGTTAIEFTPMDINYELKLKSEVQMIKSKPKLISFDLSGKDVEGRPNKDFKTSFAYNRNEETAQQIINASLVCPGREMSYYSETKQVKDLTFVGKVIVSPQKGKSAIVEYKISTTNPTKDFHAEVESEISYSHRPEKAKAKTSLGWLTPDKFEYKHTVSKDGQKYSDWDIQYDKSSNALQAKMVGRERQAELKVDNVKDPRNAQWGLRLGPKAYKMSAVRVPKESLTLKLDSAENTRIKEMRVKLSRKEKSTLKMVTSDNMEINAFVDPIAKDKRAHLDVKCPKHKIDHVGDVVLNSAARKITWDSKTNLDGKPFITIEAQLTPKERTFFILKKIKDPNQVSKVEYFYEKGVYGGVVDTSRFSAVLEGECKNNKNFGKIGFVDKVNNYEHKSQYNVSNGILTIKSISDEEKQTFTKLDAVIGRRIISNVSLITPKVNAQLTANPLGEKKTLVFKWVSPRYDHDSNVEWVPRKYLKVDSVSLRKTEPPKRMKMDAYLTREQESTFKVTAPNLDVDIRRVIAPKPKYVFNTTINGYNEVQEFDSNPSLSPLQNLMVALSKTMSQYTSDN